MIHILLFFIKTGDIAFRFLQFIESQSTSSSDSQHINSLFTNSERETGTPVSTSSTDTTDESPSSSSDDESSSTGKNEWRKALDEQGSHVTVCDINQPMLDVGKQKALRKGYKTGNRMRFIYWAFSAGVFII